MHRSRGCSGLILRKPCHVWGGCRLLLAGGAFALFGVGSGCSSLPRPPAGFDLGPIVSRVETVDGIDRIRVLGGIGEHSVGPNGEVLSACRPLTARLHDPSKQSTLHDMLWPVGTIRQRGERLGWRFLLLYGLNDDVGDPSSRSHFWLFPFFYHGQSREGERSTGFFPFYGVGRDIAGIDKIRFVLFPLFAQTEDGGSRTTVVLWPFYRRTIGPRDDQFRLWPFYGRHEREGRWRKRFILWPFWSQVTYNRAGREGGGFILFPRYGKAEVGNSSLRMWIPPFFQHATWDEGYRVCAPWPFIDWSRAGEDYAHTVWPLASSKQVGAVRSRYQLWPIFWQRKAEHSDAVASSFRMVPFLYSGKEVVAPQASPARASSRDFMLWPLLDYRREGDRSKARMLALWPLRHSRGVERSWAPLWTLYSRERAGDRRQTEFLWGMYRHTRDAQRRRISIFPLVSYRRDRQNDEVGWSLLCGLLGRSRNGAASAWRVFFMGGDPAPAEAGDGDAEDRGECVE